MKEERTPILVNNPYRNVLMNVEPLFNLIAVYHPEEGFEKADLGIKLAALTNESDWVFGDERKSVIMFLYEIRDLFSAMKECQISIPAKKGGAA